MNLLVWLAVRVRVHPIDGANTSGRVCEAGWLWCRRRQPAAYLPWRRSATERQDSADEHYRQLLPVIRLEDVRDGVKVLLLEFRAHGVPCMTAGISDEVRVFIVGGHARIFGARSDTWTRVDCSSRLRKPLTAHRLRRSLPPRLLLPLSASDSQAARGRTFR